MIRPAVLASALAIAGGAAWTAGATGASLAGTVTGGPLPTASRGTVDVRAVNLRTLQIAGVAHVTGARRWAIRGVDAGVYSVLTSVVRATGAPLQAISPAVRARRGRVGVTTSLARRRPPRPRPRRPAEIVAHASPAPVVVVRAFAGSGPNAFLGRGLATMLITDLGTGDADCRIRQREGIREDLIAQEIALQNSPLVDPSQRITPNPLRAGVEVRGSVGTTADGMTWSIQLVDTATGAVVGGDEGSARGASGILGEAPAQIAGHLLDQICGDRYDVALTLRTDARFASHMASGTISAVLTATGTRSANGAPPARFDGTGPAAYENLSFIPSNECALSNPVSNPGAWTVALEVTPAGRLRVTWDPEASGVPTGTATVTCPGIPPVPVPGFPGPSLVDPSPRTFEVPVAGGTQAIGGGVQSGSQGWTHAGSITLTRLPR